MTDNTPSPWSGEGLERSALPPRAVELVSENSGEHATWCSVFQNEDFETLLYIHLIGAGEGTLYHSDLDWAPAPVVEGVCGSVTLRPSEVAWLALCGETAALIEDRLEKWRH